MILPAFCQGWPATELLTLCETAATLGVTPFDARRLLGEGRLPFVAYTPAGAPLFERAMIEQLAARPTYQPQCPEC